jgi:hypothetical protein
MPDIAALDLAGILDVSRTSIFAVVSSAHPEPAKMSFSSLDSIAGSAIATKDPFQDLLLASRPPEWADKSAEAGNTRRNSSKPRISAEMAVLGLIRHIGDACGRLHRRGACGKDRPRLAGGF